MLKSKKSNVFRNWIIKWKILQPLNDMGNFYWHLLKTQGPFLEKTEIPSREAFNSYMNVLNLFRKGLNFDSFIVRGSNLEPILAQAAPYLVCVWLKT